MGVGVGGKAEGRGEEREKGFESAVARTFRPFEKMKDNRSCR